MRRPHDSARPRGRRARLLERLRFRKADDLLPRLEDAALLQNLHALETLEDIALGHDGPETFETAMLRHGKWFPWKRGAKYSRGRRGCNFFSVISKSVAH